MERVVKLESVWRPALVLALLGPHLFSGASHGETVWRFVDATEAAGLSYITGYESSAAESTPARRVAGGVAAADFDRDGFVDLYVEVGDVGRNLLFRNLGDGRFDEVGLAAGVGLDAFPGSGPLFFDFDGDGWDDLFVGAIGGSEQPKLFRNQGDGTFSEVPGAGGIMVFGNTISASAGDYDGDGWLDLFLTHWSSPVGDCHLWRNERGQGFVCADADAGLGGLVEGEIDQTFTGNFADLDGDRRLDLLVTSDFGTSSVWLNRGARFENVTTATIADENGMGAAIGDYDSDGDLDWFVSSIYDAENSAPEQWGHTGNRMYENVGGGDFVDATDRAGVRDGAWGWGASLADLNNDGWLDLVHVNGWPEGSKFRNTASRLFIGSPTSRFDERSVELGFDDAGDGRGIVCFDFDRDGDLDVFVANLGGAPKLWRNDGGNLGGYLSVRLEGTAPNSRGIGASVLVHGAGRTLLRAMRAGTNYVSQNPPELHFGLGATPVESVEVLWPDGTTTSVGEVSTNEILIERRPRPSGGCG